VTPLIYLATPYSHTDFDVMLQRFNTVNAVSAKLMVEGHHIFSPISHTHPIAMAGQLPTGWDYWEQYDRAILSICKELWVLKQEGWQDSKGVQGEIAIALELELPIKYLDV
jgi:hypothetical protein